MTVTILDASSEYAGSDIQTVTIELHKRLVTDYKYEYRTIDQPSIIDIGGVKAGTFLVTFKEKYETNPVRGASQYWIVSDGTHGYLFNFISTPETFDHPDSTEM